MKVFFDCQTFVQQEYGGISRYFCELITGINEVEECNAHLSLLWSNNIHLQEYNIPVYKYPFHKGKKILKLSNYAYNCMDAKINIYDVLHTTYFDDFLIPYIERKPVVTTFHDMIYEKLSNRFTELANDEKIVQQKRNIAQRASHLIAISESTKKDMVDLLDVNPEKITVIYHGGPFQQLDSTTFENNSNYLLFVGNRSGYKNFHSLLHAVAPILRKYKLYLICAGGGNFTTIEKNIIQSLSISALVEYRKIDDAVLKKLYREAIAFLFPTIYEGFGLPILEAFACNCPCVISNTSSLPEVAGNAALYFNPDDLESITHSVENIILNTGLRKELIMFGRDQLTKFSWQQAVSQTLSVYNKVIVY